MEITHSLSRDSLSRRGGSLGPIRRTRLDIVRVPGPVAFSMEDLWEDVRVCDVFLSWPLILPSRQRFTQKPSAPSLGAANSHESFCVSDGKSSFRHDEGGSSVLGRPRPWGLSICCRWIGVRTWVRSQFCNLPDPSAWARFFLSLHLRLLTWEMAMITEPTLESHLEGETW